MTVPVTTLDDLILRYGEPTFCKIDVEGYEAAVLHGLSRPLAVLSFEYVPAAQDIALDCVARLQQLDEYEFNWSCGEEHRWQSAHWVSSREVGDFLKKLAVDDRSGDVYARRIDDRRHPARHISPVDQ